MAGHGCELRPVGGGYGMQGGMGMAGGNGHVMAVTVCRAGVCTEVMGRLCLPYGGARFARDPMALRRRLLRDLHNPPELPPAGRI